jgi:hypothetical protein
MSYYIKAEDRNTKKRVRITSDMEKEYALLWTASPSMKKMYRYFRVVENKAK